LIQLTGVEGFRGNIREASMYYDTLIFGDIREYYFYHEMHDLTIMTDVIEHFEKDEAVRMLRKMDDIIITTPLFDYKQGAADGNELEIHRCFFTEEELTRRGYSLLHTVEHDGKGKIGAFIK
jgi:hypothetical protein